MTQSIMTREVSETKSGKRQDILLAAVTVFAADGFRNTDVQLIADRAGVGKGTVYRHFGNKEQLFLETARFCNETRHNYVIGQLDGHPTPQSFQQAHGAAILLRRIAQACARFYQGHPQYLEILIQESLEFRETNDPLLRMFRENSRATLDRIVEVAIQQGEFRLCEIRSVSDTYIDLLFGCLIRGCSEGDHNHLVQRIDRAVELLLVGLVDTSMSSLRDAEPRMGCVEEMTSSCQL